MISSAEAGSLKFNASILEALVSSDRNEMFCTNSVVLGMVKRILFVYKKSLELLYIFHERTYYKEVFERMA